MHATPELDYILNSIQSAVLKAHFSCGCMAHCTAPHTVNQTSPIAHSDMDMA